MECQVSTQGDIVLITISGEVDLFYSPKLREIILEHLNEKRHVALELSSVSYIDSSGIASLVEGFQFSKSNHLEFALIATSNAVMQVLRLARLDKVIPLYDSIEEFKV